jgi:autophagy-related protein 16-1
MIKVWDVNTAVNKGKMGCSSGVYGLDVAMTDSVVATGHRDGAVRLWSIRDSKLMHEIKGVHDSIVSSCQYVPGDGNHIVTSSRDQTIKLIDLRMFKVLATYENEFYYTTYDTS